MAALTISNLSRTVIGNKRMTTGSAATTGTTGEINTGLRICEFISVMANDGSVSADAVTLNETFPCDGSAITVIHTAGVAALEFMAVGS